MLDKDSLNLYFSTPSIVALTALTPLAAIPICIGIVVFVALRAVRFQGVVMNFALWLCTILVTILGGGFANACPANPVALLRPCGVFRVVQVPVFAVSHSSLGAVIACDARPFFRPPLFSPCVAHVVGVSSEKQVGWIAAGRVIAVVQDVHPFGYGADSDNPGGTLRAHVIAANRESAVTILVFECEKLPALAFSFAVDLSPKAGADGIRDDHRNLFEKEATDSADFINPLQPYKGVS